MKHRRSCLAPLALGVALLAAVTADARAQINAESLRRKPLRPGLGAALEASFALAQGNVELLDFGATGRVQYQTLYPEPPAPTPDPAPGTTP